MRLQSLVHPCVRALAVSLALGFAAGSGRAAEQGATAPRSARPAFAAELHVTGMTYLDRGGSLDELEVHAREGFLHPEKDEAELFDVHMTSSNHEKGRNFDVTCARGVLDTATNDFLAEGDVRGSTGDGRSYQAPWVRYDHERALLYTDAPVVMQDATGTFRGDGFRYELKQRRFRLLGNVSVEQRP